MLILAALAFASESGCRASFGSADYDLADLECRDCADRWCRGRLAWLAARRDPAGGWAGAEALERARRAPDPQVVSELAGDPAVSEVVRADAACAVARNLRDPAAAWALLAPWVAVRDRMPEEVRRPLIELGARALLALGRDAEARALAPRSVRPVAQARREAQGAVVGGTVAAVFAVAIAPRALRHRRLGHGGWILTLIGLVAAALAEGYARGAGWRIAAVTAALVPFHLLCAAAAEAPGPAFRVGALISTLALAYSVAWAVGGLPW